VVKVELRQIKYFIEVARVEHVTEAANNLHVAQSAVSRQIANLEDELGAKLFLREGRNVKLTPVGKIFQNHMLVVLNEMEKAVQSVEEYLNPKAGVVRIGFPNSLAAKTLPTVLSAFRDEHPNIGFKLRQGSNRELMEAVKNGEINLAFVSPVPDHDEKIFGHVFFTEKMVALLPSHHHLADRQSIRLRELRNDSFVLFRKGYAMRDIVLDACSLIGFQPIIAFEGEDIDTIRGLVGAGLGVGFLPEVAIGSIIGRESVTIDITDPIMTRTVGMITPKNRELAPSETLFYTFLRDFYEKLQRFGQ
jgi:LysR family transcriptional activator of glutamate synthase operon